LFPCLVSLPVTSLLPVVSLCPSIDVNPVLILYLKQDQSIGKRVEGTSRKRGAGCWHTLPLSKSITFWQNNPKSLLL
jgi:hypothetical protein